MDSGSGDTCSNKNEAPFGPGIGFANPTIDFYSKYAIDYFLPNYSTNRTENLALEKRKNFIPKSLYSETTSTRGDVQGFHHYWTHFSLLETHRTFENALFSNFSLSEHNLAHETIILNVGKI